MDGVATKISQKIRMLFENENLHALPGEKKAQHHAGGPASDDAAAGLKSL